jgi:hypothetical protein
MVERFMGILAWGLVIVMSSSASHSAGNACGNLGDILMDVRVSRPQKLWLHRKQKPQDIARGCIAIILTTKSIEEACRLSKINKPLAGRL